ncbi:hypothetical protein D3C74_378100 [compost metagenome]
MLGGPVVAADRVRTAGQQVPGLTGRHRVVVVVHDEDLVGRGDGPPLRPDDDLARVARPGVADEPLGHAEDLLERVPEHLDQAFGRARPELGSPDLEDLERGEVVRRDERRGRPDVRERRHERHVRDPVPLDQGERDVGRAVRGQDDGPARVQHAQDAG